MSHAAGSMMLSLQLAAGIEGNSWIETCNGNSFKAADELDLTRRLFRLRHHHHHVTQSSHSINAIGPL
jgi:hypothetical protein